MLTRRREAIRWVRATTPIISSIKAGLGEISHQGRRDVPLGHSIMLQLVSPSPHCCEPSWSLSSSSLPILHVYSKQVEDQSFLDFGVHRSSPLPAHVAKRGPPHKLRYMRCNKMRNSRWNDLSALRAIRLSRDEIAYISRQQLQGSLVFTLSTQNDGKLGCELGEIFQARCSVR